jgi:hypothetical protein
MLNPKAEAAAAIEEPDGRTVSEVSLNERISRCRADPAGHCGRLKPETGLLARFGVRSQGHSVPESVPSGCPSGEYWLHVIG